VTGGPCGPHESGPCGLSASDHHVERESDRNDH